MPISRLRCVGGPNCHSIVPVALEDPGMVDHSSLLVNRLHDPVLALGDAEARQALVEKMR